MKRHLNGKADLILAFALALLVGLASGSFWPLSAAPVARGSQELGSVSGQSATLLSDGRWLLIGGEGPEVLNTIALHDPTTNTTTILETVLNFPRTWHSATVLPNGTVLIWGGTGLDGLLVQQGELFDPATLQVSLLEGLGLTPRAHHSATLLTDGLVLFAGGATQNSEASSLAELLDSRSGDVLVVPNPMRTTRRGHTATLLSTGEVLLWGGQDRFGTTLDYGESYDPMARRFSLQASPADPRGHGPARLEASIPENRAEDARRDGLVALRFSKPVEVRIVNSQTVSLEGPEGTVPARVIAAEGGMLVFITPKEPLAYSTTYTVSVANLAGRDGLPVTPGRVIFTTESSPDEGEVWLPGSNSPEDWHSDYPDPTGTLPPPLQAQPGVTALAGQVLKLNNRPLPNVTIEVAGQTTTTDETGRFLLTGIPAGRHLMIVNGETASKPGLSYCSFELGVNIAEGVTTALPRPIWLPVEDIQHATMIPVPTDREIVVTTPRIPGLEVRIPAGVILRTRMGHPLTRLSITPMPVDRAPWPLPAGAKVSMFYVFQAHGSRVESVTGQPTPGIRIISPNNGGLEPGAQVELWNYSAARTGWYIYGSARVSGDGKKIVPNPDVGLRYLNCLTFWSPFNWFPNSWVPPGDDAWDGDPVHLGTGLFVHKKTDLVVPDTIPIVLTRVYRQKDTATRQFGIGFSHSYELALAGDGINQGWAILPDGGRLHYTASSGWRHGSSPTGFQGSTISGGPLKITMKDGTRYIIGGYVAGVSGSEYSWTWLDGIEDRHGNRLDIKRDVIPTTGINNAKILEITTPNGRWVRFSHDTTGRITEARDNIGRVVTYEYDAEGRLWKVTDAEGGVTEYGYDSGHRMTTIKDGRGLVYLTNEYDENDRVSKQTLVDGSTFEFTYIPWGGGGGVSETRVKRPLGDFRRVTFNTDGYSLNDTMFWGTPQEYTRVRTRQATSNFVNTYEDALGRRTEFAFNSDGNVTGVTRLAGTPEAVTTSFTYEPTFEQLASLTDPLNRTVTIDYDTQGNPTSVTDPLDHESTFTYNAAGQLLTATNPLGKTTQFAYDGADLVSITDPLGRTVNRYFDSAGRVAIVTDPLGNQSEFEYNRLNQVTKITDAQGGQTPFTYDPNGNLLSLSDARGNTTSYTYDNMDRLATRTDPLLNSESYQYDLAGKLTQFTDRRGKVTKFTYDVENRLGSVGFGWNGTSYESTIGYTYDAVDRLTQVVDSQSGTITLAYDNLDRLTSETTPQGAVSYGYDAVGRRTSMTVAGQPVVNYTYDNADRLTQITQGTSTVAFGYDAGDRRTSLTLPNGIVVSYAYDDASQLTGMIYSLGANTLGNLTYAYDLVGRRTAVAGSFARTGLPQAVTSATYNVANQLTQWNATALTYDAEGNLTSDGTNTYNWDAGNQLVSISGGATASFTYDAFGRRVQRTAGGATRSFLYDGLNTVQEQLGGGQTANLLTGGLDQYFMRTDPAWSQHYLADGLGSTLGLADNSGSILTQYTYEAFGLTSVSGAAAPQLFQYTGRENDGTGLFYYRARYYHPTLQRFISEDPIGFAGGDVNLYGYVLNSPTIYVDPLGLDKDRVSCEGSVDAYSLNGTWDLGIPGALIGEGVGGPPGVFIGYAIGRMFGVGANVSWVPSTNQWYAGPTGVFSPGVWGATGVSVTGLSFPDQQSAANVLSGWSGFINYQPIWWGGATVVKSPGSPPVVGNTIGSRVPLVLGGGYNWRVWNGQCQ